MKHMRDSNSCRSFATMVKCMILSNVFLVMFQENFTSTLSDEDNLQDFNVSSRHMPFIGISYHTKTFELQKKLAKVRTILLKFSFDSFLSTLSKWAVLDYVIQLIG